MDFHVLVLAAPIEDNMIFNQKSTKFQAHFYKIVWKSVHSWSMPIEDKIVLAKKVWNSKLIFIQLSESHKHRGMPIEDKWFFAKKVWNSELIFYLIVWKTPRHSYRGQMIFCQKSVEIRTHLYKIVYKSEQERVLVIFSKTKLNTFSPPGDNLCFLSFPWYRDFEWKSNQSPLSHWINTRGGALNFFFR